MHFPKKLEQKLEERKSNNALRQLGNSENLIDFSSNDYLGFSKSEELFNDTHAFLIQQDIKQNGATGSRLLSGNHELYNVVETQISKCHNSASALIFNSGYDANLGFFSCVPQRGDVILYDEFSHASIRDGISMSHAKGYKFKHNDLADLSQTFKRIPHDNIYVVTESVFSMDGDSPDLKALSKLCKTHNAFLIVDEAHAIGVFSNKGEGLVQQLHLEHDVFARIVTFGKAMGCHGAAVLGNETLKQYLVNFCRSFIYTTGLSPHAVTTIKTAYDHLESKIIKKLHQNINYFKKELQRLQLESLFIESDSAIHCCVISGNDKVKSIATQLKTKGFNVKPILSPTVPRGEERLRFCLHAYNSEKEITEVLELLTTFVGT